MCHPSPTWLRVVVETMAQKLYYSILEKLNTHLMYQETMEFETVYTRVCSWCCEIAVGTKKSSLISWQVMFFKCEKSTMENFYVPTINVLERKLLAPHPIRTPPIYTKEKGSNIPKCDLVTWNFCAIVPRFLLKI